MAPGLVEIYTSLAYVVTVERFSRQTAVPQSHSFNGLPNGDVRETCRNNSVESYQRGVA